MGGRAVIAVVVLVLGGFVAGLSAWVGVAVEGGGVPFTTLVLAGINVVPAAICLLGIGILAMGAWPRTTSYVVYGYLGWSLFIELIGGFGSGSRWLLDTSLYHQMAAAPAVDPNWAVNGVMLGIGAVAVLLGMILFQRRDLQSS
jgi:ABC-2 type transport system permease protein